MGAVLGAMASGVGYGIRQWQAAVNQGSGPVAGVIEASSTSKSNRLLRNYSPRDGMIEFVFDPTTKTFAVGRPRHAPHLTGSAHQQLARSIGANEEVVLGGMFMRGINGTIITTELSGHYGSRWTPELRRLFVSFMENFTQLPIQHHPY